MRVMIMSCDMAATCNVSACPFLVFISLLRRSSISAAHHAEFGHARDYAVNLYKALLIALVISRGSTHQTSTHLRMEDGGAHYPTLHNSITQCYQSIPSCAVIQIQQCVPVHIVCRPNLPRSIRNLGLYFLVLESISGENV